ncbi:MAG: hypothetical protein HQL07_04965 [Nitrospirae bacterium]|nr:hypothetical protein [Magnetococcales bacterium]
MNKTVELSPKEFAHKMAEMSREDHFFGGVHGFHEHCMQEPTQCLGGRFVALARDPLLRIDSLFRHHIDALRAARAVEFLNLATFYLQCRQLHERLVYTFEDCHLIEKYETLDQLMGHLEELCFLWVVLGTLSTDQSLSILDDRQIFHMDDYTQERDRFRDLFLYLTQDRLPCTEAYLDQVFHQGKVNRHRKKGASKDPIRVFLGWPAKYQKMFLLLATHVFDKDDFPLNLGYETLRDIILSSKTIIKSQNLSEYGDIII